MTALCVFFAIVFWGAAIESQSNFKFFVFAFLSLSLILVPQVYSVMPA